MTPKSATEREYMEVCSFQAIMCPRQEKFPRNDKTVCDEQKVNNWLGIVRYPCQSRKTTCSVNEGVHV